MRYTLLGIMTGVLFLALSTVVLAEGPAVSALNAKISGQYGSVDNDNGWTGDASISIPVCDFVGAQIDGSLGEIDIDAGETADFSGVGLHLFHRDPRSYLVGLIGIYAELEDYNVSLYGAEVEGYFGPVTISTVGGGLTGDIDDSAFGSLDLRWYPTGNIMVELGGSLADEDERAHVGAEIQVAGALALFADVATGDNSYDHVFGGVRYYFGAQKSLIDRHRQDDPHFTPSRLILSSLNGINASKTLPPVATTTDSIEGSDEGPGDDGGLDAGW